MGMAVQMIPKEDCIHPTIGFQYGASVPHHNPITCLPMTRAVTYCRISQDYLGTEAGVTRQRKDTDAIVAANGWTVVERIVDNDRSASKFARRKREGWERLMHLVESGEVDAVVAYDLDRLTRQPKELERLLDAAENGLQVRTATGALNLADGGGIFVARTLCGVAAMEVDRMSARQKAKQRHDAAAGKPHWTRRPYGYSFDGQLVPAEADWVRTWVGWLLDDGMSTSAIARRMNELGERTATGMVGMWQGQAVRGILASPRIAALREYHGDIVGAAAWPAIVSEDERTLILAALQARSKGSVGPGRVAMLSGLVRCDSCNLTMQRSMTTVRSRKYQHWRCVKQPGRAGCNMTINAAEVERIVSDFVLEALGSVSATPARRSVGAVDVASRLRNELDELAAMFGAGQLSMTEWKAARVPLERRFQAAERSVARDAAQSALQRLVGDTATLSERWGVLAVEDRRRIVGLVVAEVRVTRGDKRANRVDPSRFRIVPVT